MASAVTLNTRISFNQLAQLARQLSPNDKRRLVKLLEKETLPPQKQAVSGKQKDQEPTIEEIVENFRSDIIALKQGTLKTRPLQDLLNEL